MVKRVIRKNGGGGQETPLKAVINEQCMLKNTEDRNGKVRTDMYASDYGQCPRKIYFSFFPDEYAPEELSPRVIRIFQNGESVHERLSEYLSRDPEIQFHEEVDVPRDELEVHGRCDGICLKDGKFIVAEFKSINRPTVYEVKDEHKGQIEWYMGMWDLHRRRLRGLLALPKDGGFVTEAEVEAAMEILEDPKDYEKMLLLSQGPICGEVIYESKQNQEIFSFPVEYSDEHFQKVKLWYQQLKWHLDNKKPPERKYFKGSFPCSWGSLARKNFGKCPYYDVCWGSDSTD